MPAQYRNALLCVALMACLEGCNRARTADLSTAETRSDPPQRAALIRPSPESQRFVHRGRYGLLSTQPTAEQHDPLLQIIDVHLAPSLQSSVGDAVDYLLLRSGYSRCAATPAVSTLFSRPLPSVHYRLGPVSLRQALEVLAGEAWQLDIDRLLRTVCFIQRRSVTLVAPQFDEVLP